MRRRARRPNARQEVVGLVLWRGGIYSNLNCLGEMFGTRVKTVK